MDCSAEVSQLFIGDLQQDLNYTSIRRVPGRNVLRPPDALASNFMTATTKTRRTTNGALDPLLKKLLKAAQTAARKSYAPYSRFRVGAALLLANGEVVTGTNVENASYCLAICAERSALVQAVSRFGPKIRVKAVAVTNLNKTASSPCGACRQMLAEFTEAEAPVVFPDKDGVRVMPFHEIFPLAFEIEP